MKPEIYIREEHPTKKNPPFCWSSFFFPFFWKNLHEHQNSEKQFKMKTRKTPPNRKKPFIEKSDELNTVKPVNIASLSSLDQFTN